MKDHTDITSFHAAVDAIPLMGFQTRIDRALRLAQNELFAPKNGISLFQIYFATDSV